MAMKKQGRLLQQNGVCCYCFVMQSYLFSSILPTPIFLYNQRKHVKKHQFPLVIDTFLLYFQRKHIKKHHFPLIIVFYYQVILLQSVYQHAPFFFCNGCYSNCGCKIVGERKATITWTGLQRNWTDIGRNMVGHSFIKFTRWLVASATYWRRGHRWCS